MAADGDDKPAMDDVDDCLLAMSVWPSIGTCIGTGVGKGRHSVCFGSTQSRLKTQKR